MRFLPSIFLLLTVQLLAGCESLPWINAEHPVAEASPAENPFESSQCPVAETVVCAEPEVKVVERVIERHFEKIVEVPVAKDKLVLGSEEYFTVEPGGLRLLALIDSGAATSSLSVRGLTRFERDGSNWVRFNLTDGEVEPVKIELPIKRQLRIFRPGFDRQRRPSVEMSLAVGGVTHMVEVNLTENSNGKFPLLVGRNFLRDTAVVDVSRKRVQSNPQLPSFSK